jgi:pentalenene oxygenase
MLGDDRTFDNGAPLFDTARKVVGDNVINTSHSRHRRQRRLIDATFLRRRMPRCAATMAAEFDAAMLTTLAAPRIRGRRPHR